MFHPSILESVNLVIHFTCCLQTFWYFDECNKFGDIYDITSACHLIDLRGLMRSTKIFHPSLHGPTLRSFPIWFIVRKCSWNSGSDNSFHKLNPNIFILEHLVKHGRHFKYLQYVFMFMIPLYCQLRYAYGTRPIILEGKAR